jgi:chromosomal replication initiation ATPase DnaA
VIRASMPAAPAPLQLALPLEHRESFAREDFLEGTANAAALALIEGWPDWPDRLVAIVGPSGAGKSHLAAIWAARSGARFLAGRALGETHLAAALATGALVLEDVPQQNLDEHALFHLINLARQEQACVLITARTPPHSWRVAIRDVASRLRAIPYVTLAAPDDGLLRAVIVKLCADRQLAIDAGVITYLVNRIERSFAFAREVVDLIDREALRRQRSVTRALARELLRDIQVQREKQSEPWRS